MGDMVLGDSSSPYYIIVNIRNICTTATLCFASKQLDLAMP